MCVHAGRCTLHSMQWNTDYLTDVDGVVAVCVCMCVRVGGGLQVSLWDVGKTATTTSLQLLLPWWMVVGAKITEVFCERL